MSEKLCPILNDYINRCFDCHICEDIKMHERTKHTHISATVKRRVLERDQGCCVYCGSPYGFPDAHFIPRSHGGLGIEENILTLCRVCHERYDNSPDRERMREFFIWYLRQEYPDWNEEKLIYGKET